jgi:hypothetical protein
MATSANRPRRIYIDSDNRVSGTHNDFEIELPQSVVGCTAGEPISVTVPLACYPIPSYEQYLYWTTQTTPAVIYRTELDVARNYTSMADLVTTLNYAVVNSTVRMDTLAPVALGTSALIFTFNADTKKLEFTANDFMRFMGYMEAPIYYHNLSYRLGFTVPTNSGWYAASAGYKAMLPDQYAFPSILRTSCIYLACSLCQGDSMTTADSGNRDLLVKIPVTTADSGLGSIIQYQNNMKDRTITSMPHTFKRIRVRLFDEEQMPLELANNGKGTVQVELRCFYD